MTEGDKILRTQAWDYFAIVAAQRMTVIRFYISLATLLAGGQLALIQNPKYSIPSVTLGLLSIALSFIFWKWDRRSSELIKLAEGTLRYYETKIEIEDDGPEGEVARLLTREHKFTENRKAGTPRFSSYFTYKICLLLLYSIFAGIGLVCSVVAVAAMILSKL